MNLKKALETLEINTDNKYIYTNSRSININYVKKQYHKIALLCHPDKNNNSTESNEMFKLLNESYMFIKNKFDNNHKMEHCDSDSEHLYDNVLHSYEHIVKNFIKIILKGEQNNNIANIIYNIITNIKSSSMKMLDNINKETLLTIYTFISKYKLFLNINSEIINQLSILVKTKYTDEKNNNLLLLTPSLKDLLDSNVYKLCMDQTMYLIPLWHSSLVFDIENDSQNINNGELVVSCIPDIPYNMSIDENNNLLIHVCFNLTNEFLINCNDIHIDICNLKISIRYEEIKFKRVQYFIYKNKGIPLINQDDVYDNSIRGDITIKLIIVV
jgi:hypothetical protein